MSKKSAFKKWFSKTDPGLEEKILIGLEQIGRAIAMLQDHESRAQNLSDLQMNVIVSLLEPHHARTIGGVAAELNLTPPTISDAVRALERKDLLHKTRDPEDERVVRLDLTARGRTTARRLKEKQNPLLKVITHLTEEEKTSLLSLLIKLTTFFQDKGLISVARLCANCQYFHPNRYPGTEKPHHCGFVDSPFGEPELQIDCSEHRAVQATTDH
jgi:DNA-binding MarR family transcriptional regulator